ncbi:MAG: phage shock protein PspA [Rhodospirillales bacterium]|nr:phage shock protein PspA [Rhodospirillaceae bacterium]MDP6426483.1 phage shock protein PspA [Rhodospirillales bacterium]MDP6643016.1 phage shock protein PspA [Rhodospirillales bacterium]MDP6842160.1 phage shock protein PspA [Rhodospirillales bacterium]|tara:strand:- start:1814 stop:2524 length:711 start_codon:yes stop_codon:yes gene_type:complete
MGIFSRLSDIVNSNLTSMLDKAEDPEKIIRLMILEMQETLVEVRSDAARIIADRKEAERTLGRLRDAGGEWQRKAELALTKEREDLAKGALLEKAKLEETADLLEQDLDSLDRGLSKHDADIAKLEAKLREAKAKQKTMQARQKSASTNLRVRRQVHDGRIDDAFARFENMERRIDSVEGEAEAFDLGKGKSLAEEIAELEAEQAIEGELAALKARVAEQAARKSGAAKKPASRRK